MFTKKSCRPQDRETFIKTKIIFSINQIFQEKPQSQSMAINLIPCPAQYRKKDISWIVHLLASFPINLHDYWHSIAINSA